jgi:triosephosphate isomerase
LKLTMRLPSAASLLSFAASAAAFAPQKADFGRAATRLFSVRKPFITGNWKLNPQTKQEAIELATGIADAVGPSSPGDVALFVPFPFLEAVQQTVGDKLSVGAEVSRRVHERTHSCLSTTWFKMTDSSHENLFFYVQMVTPEEKGAFTGGVSPIMLKSMGIDWALAGHSERRTLFGEDDEYINAQCRMLVENDMNVVLCIGETLEEFEKNLVGPVCEVQLKKGLAGISAQDMSKVTVAYEPVWAIGTGKVATPEIAQDVHAVCRNILKHMFGGSVAEETRILYGGSVSPDSVDGLLAKPDIDGALVGGASLDASSFSRIINFQTVPALVLA